MTRDAKAYYYPTDTLGSGIALADETGTEYSHGNPASWR